MASGAHTAKSLWWPTLPTKELSHTVRGMSERMLVCKNTPVRLSDKTSEEIRYSRQKTTCSLISSAAPRASGEGCLSSDPSPLFQPCLAGNAGAHVPHDAETCTLSTIPSSTLFPFPHAPPAHSSPCVYTSPRCVLTSAAAYPTKPSPAFLKNFSRLRSPKYNAILTNSGHISDVMPN